MAGDDLFKRYMEVGASMLGMSRERAEGIVRDLVASGEVARSQATKAADWLVERGRTGTEELRELVRKEIRQQIAALGLATRDDIARLEARLEEVRSAAAAKPRATKATGAGTATKATKAAGTGRSRATSPKPAAAAKAPKSAGISRSASVRKRAAAPGATEPGGSSPGGARRQKA